MFSFFILGVVPALFWIWLFYIFNRYKRTSAKLLILLFLGGLLCGLLALTLNHIVEKYTIFWSDARETTILFDFLPPLPLHNLGFWLMVGFNEELAKLIVILLIAYPSRDFQEPFDGVLYAAVVALGFATIENAFYVEQYGISILLTRTLITLPTHIFISVPMGYYVARSRFALSENPTKQKVHLESVILLLKGWGIAALLHAGYDSFLSLGFKELAYAQLFIMGGATLILRNHCLQLSQLAPSSVK